MSVGEFHQPSPHVVVATVAVSLLTARQSGTILEEKGSRFEHVTSGIGNLL